MTRPLKARFNEKFIKLGPDECWIWLAAVNSKGYGVIRNEDTMWLAHRVAWVFENGPIPDGLDVLHSCDIPPCVNPGHLFLGTNMDNINDMLKKGRSPKGSNRPNAILTEDDVREIRHAYIPYLVTQQQLADKFGVSRGSIQDIINNQTWRHVD